jgi:hypothetical protein
MMPPKFLIARTGRFMEGPGQGCVLDRKASQDGWSAVQFEQLDEIIFDGGSGIAPLP